MLPREPYHEGEIAMQERAGERASAMRNGAAIRDSLTPAAREFLRRQRTVALATLDAGGRPWASLCIGQPGFVRSEHECSVDVSREPHLGSPDDPVLPLLRVQGQIGMLAIDLESRRRLRVNGVIAAARDDRFTVAVREAFPNCAKYIQRRVVEIDAEADLVRSRPAPSRGGPSLPPELRSLAERVDTLFVASRHSTRGIDVSHRGGDPGFVRSLDERTLRIPDYAGNGMFTTLGNFGVDPRCGVAMLDFERGEALSITGVASVDVGVEDPDHPTGGTGRYWTIDVAEWRTFPLPDHAAFHFVERSPYHPSRSVVCNGGVQP